MQQHLLAARMREAKARYAKIKFHEDVDAAVGATLDVVGTHRSSRKRKPSAGASAGKRAGNLRMTLKKLMTSGGKKHRFTDKSASVADDVRVTFSDHIGVDDVAKSNSTSRSNVRTSQCCVAASILRQQDKMLDSWVARCESSTDFMSSHELISFDHAKSVMTMDSSVNGIIVHGCGAPVAVEVMVQVRELLLVFTTFTTLLRFVIPVIPSADTSAGAIREGLFNTPTSSSVTEKAYESEEPFVFYCLRFHWLSEFPGRRCAG